MDEYETAAGMVSGAARIGAEATEYAAGLDSNRPDGLAAATAKSVAKTN